MSDRRQTLIVSDLHLGGGAADPGDDHVYQDRQLERFVRQRLASPAGQAGDIELFFNGDFLEFAQVRPQAYRSPSADYWCSEAESLEKLEAILAGHDNSFAALHDFQAAGNRVTLAAGNHDVDLYWPAVRKRLRARIGPGLRFATGVDWVERHDGRLHIGHGHLEDPANRFKHWSAPILRAPDGARLEMCPGTLFMVRFVNGLEARYPFADNLHPVQNLATILLREDAGGFASAGWMLLKFIARHAKTLGSSEAADVGRRLLARLREDDAFAQRLAAASRLLGDDRSCASVRRDVSDEEQLADLMQRLFAVLPADEWLALFALRPAPVLGAGGSKTLGTIIGARHFGREALRDLAQRRFDACPAAQVIVMGHTHLPDTRSFDKRHYLNPGSWTRYLDLEKHPPLRLDDLRDEARFPYELNYVVVEADADGTPLVARLECFERREPEGEMGLVCYRPFSALACLYGLTLPVAIPVRHAGLRGAGGAAPPRPT
ncbi:MAG: metallophosphoesterase [Candidatus Accumulibacter sp.]|uniref:hypothetical protein n=1 Tax=Accumulibacter sp. TaxID=2053492 RepID=UPI001ACDA7C5|nr:hypothetical protein [Accumulibacter sp.]MBN8519121.1 metallophosphoesterase [Accumulibacter sp.]MBO3710300.1 metallophosphoesterase [Accumulibacter sp.]